MLFSFPLLMGFSLLFFFLMGLFLRMSGALRLMMKGENGIGIDENHLEWGRGLLDS